MTRCMNCDHKKKNHSGVDRKCEWITNEKYCVCEKFVKRRLCDECKERVSVFHSWAGMELICTDCLRKRREGYE